MKKREPNQALIDLLERFHKELNSHLGEDHGIVVLAHMAHEPGGGCKGVTMFTSLTDMMEIGGILNRAIEDVALEVMSSRYQTKN